MQMEPGSRFEEQSRLDCGGHLPPQHGVLREILDPDVKRVRLANKPAHFLPAHRLDAEVHRAALPVQDDMLGMVPPGDDDRMTELASERRRHQPEFCGKLVGRE